ncbi:uncharacterized protein LOC131625554 [Vicia villosa]|uniref:uncharacterized protein LOC131625554 n=1 Tax=Vicia villosa TaxID=3911 RepID=UPI00273C7FF0|nr:uncharacterized protein LOC131625554 [Vicia villosa]
MNYSRNFVNIIVTDEARGDWRLTCYYGYPERSRRRQAWELLKEISRVSNIPWCIIGDFNDLLTQNAKAGIHSHPNWLCAGFSEAVSDCNLVDIPLEGYQFTWVKSQGTEHMIEERLDRSLATPEWLNMFPKVKLLNLIASHSS